MIYTYVATALIAAAASGLGAWRVQEWRHGAIEAAKMRAAAAATDARRVDIHQAAVRYEVVKADAEIREIKIKEEVDRVVEKIVYSNVCLDDDGLRILSSDIAARHAGGQPGATVPSPASSDPANWQKRAAVGPRSDPPL